MPAPRLDLMRLQNKLILVVMGGVLAPLLVLAILNHHNTKATLRAQLQKQLEAMAEVQRARISQMVAGKLRDISLIRSRTQLRISLQEYLRAGENAHLEKMERIVRDAAQSDGSIQSLAIVNTNAQVIVSTDDQWPPEAVRAEILRGLQEATLLRLDRAGEVGLTGLIAGPLEIDGEILGIAVIRSLITDLDRIAGDYTGMGKTGETVIALRNEHGSRYIVPLRFDPQGFARSIAEERTPIHDALDGIVRFDASSVDYRNEPVLSATQFIPETGLGLVVKMDMAEAYAPLWALMRTQIITGAVCVLLSLLISVSVAGRISRPLGELTRATNTFATSGVTEPVNESSRDEVGELARSFNRMSRQIALVQGRLQRVIDHSPSGIMVCGKDGIQLVNPQAELMFGWTADELIGQPVETLVGDSTADLFRELLEQETPVPDLRSTGVTHEFSGRRKDGAEFPIEIGLSPFADEDGSIHVLAMVSDITQRKTAERQLHQSHDELQRSNAELDQFAYVASHDLRAPLRAIDHLVTWIEDDHRDVLPASARKDLTMLRGRVNRMDALLDSLLTYCRAGRVEDRTVQVDVAQLLEDVVTIHEVPEHFTIDVAPGMPTVRAPRAVLMRVFGNLLGNAWKHHDRDSGRVRVESSEVDGFYEFRIRDDGPGIDPRFQERIFEMFQTLKPRDELEVSGMGLAIVKKTVEHHGGTIRVDSTPGEGTTFTFTWPKSPQLD